MNASNGSNSENNANNYAERRAKRNGDGKAVDDDDDDVGIVGSAAQKRMELEAVKRREEADVLMDRRIRGQVQEYLTLFLDVISDNRLDYACRA